VITAPPGGQGAGAIEACSSRGPAAACTAPSTPGYNTYRTVQGAGSGIFLHVGTGGATAGCISLTTQNVLNVMRWLNPNAHPLVAEGPSSVILY